MNPKPVIANILHHLGYVTHASAWRAKKLKVGRILMFHGVGDASNPAEEFEAHVQYLKRNFNIVTFEEFIRRKEDPGDVLANSMVLSFDDGLRNNYTVAYPVLQRLNVPATFFVCPGLIENQRWLWNHEARVRLQALGNSDQRQFASRCGIAADAGVEGTIAWMKTLSLTQRRESEQALRELTGSLQFSVEQCAQHDIMSWDELRTLNSELITIGSHTLNHPILSTLSVEDLHLEIIDSRRRLEEKLGRKVEYFCYPNGGFNPAVVEQVRQTYTAAVTTERGFVKPNSDRHLLPRISSAETLPLLAWRMHRPTA